MPTPVLENPEHQTKWYSRYFLGKFHRNYVGQDATDAKSIYALSGKLSRSLRDKVEGSLFEGCIPDLNGGKGVSSLHVLPLSHYLFKSEGLRD